MIEAAKRFRYRPQGLTANEVDFVESGIVEDLLYSQELCTALPVRLGTAVQFSVNPSHGELPT